LKPATYSDLKPTTFPILMSATGGLLPQIEGDDVSGDRIGQEGIDFRVTNVACAGFRR